MNKLEVGMYCKTKDGIITKVDDIDDDTIYFDKDIYRIYSAGIDFLEKDNLERIKKASFNIIDLIEVGDYINGRKVVSKWQEPDWYDYFIKLDGEKTIPTIRNIKTIVTREQFESMSYRIGE